MMKFALITLVIFALLLTFRFYMAAQNPPFEQPALTEEGKLMACPNSPNCIHTEYSEQSEHYLAAPDYPSHQAELVIPLAEDVIQSMGGKIVLKNSHYLSATFASTVFHFVDDFEIRRDDKQFKLHIRSASRTGYSDFGVNKKRVETFIKQFHKQVKQKHT